MSKIALAILAALSASIALADDFKTTDGTEYKNVTVTKQEPNGITVTNKKAGVIVKLYFTELPKEIQEKFNYDPEKAAAYSAEQNSAQEQLRKQIEEALRQKAETAWKNNEQLTKDQPGIQWTEEQRRKLSQLRDRYDALQKEDDDLVRRIQEAEQLPRYLTGQSGRKHYSYLNPAWRYVPDWQKSLNDVRSQKDQVRQQLEETKRSIGE